MAKKKKVTDQSNNLNLTVVALVALVAIVGLVALVLQSANLAAVPTGMQQASAEDVPDTLENLPTVSDENLVGNAADYGDCYGPVGSRDGDILCHNSGGWYLVDRDLYDALAY